MMSLHQGRVTPGRLCDVKHHLVLAKKCNVVLGHTQNSMLGQAQHPVLCLVGSTATSLDSAQVVSAFAAARRTQLAPVFNLPYAMI